MTRKSGSLRASTAAAILSTISPTGTRCSTPRWWLTRFGATWSSSSTAAAPAASNSHIARCTCTGSPKPTPPSTTIGNDERTVIRRQVSASSVIVSSASDTASW